MRSWVLGIGMFHCGERGQWPGEWALTGPLVTALLPRNSVLMSASLLAWTEQCTCVRVKVHPVTLPHSRYLYAAELC